MFLGHVLRLGVRELPHLVTLNPAALEAAERLVLVALTRFAKVDQELEHRPLGHAGHAARGPNGNAFHESGDYLGALGGAQLVHVSIYA